MNLSLPANIDWHEALIALAKQVNIDIHFLDVNGSTDRERSIDSDKSRRSLIGLSD